MVFSRRFPRDVKGSPYPVWEEVYLSKDEEVKLEAAQREANIKLLQECLEDAQKLGSDRVVELAIVLFEKRASHSVYWKEEAVKEKFDRAFRSV